MLQHLFTQMFTINKIKTMKSFTKILTIMLNANIVLTWRVLLPSHKCTILSVREMVVLSFILSDKLIEKKWTLHWRFGLTNNRVYNDAFRTFIFSMQQSISFVSTRAIMGHNRIMIILLILDFKLRNGRQLKRLLANMGIILLFLYLFIPFS
jgi:hypothetical protein